MREKQWMIYGAYGFTGRLLVEHAIARGHRPILSGRSAEKTRQIAERYGLNWVAVNLDRPDDMANAVKQTSLVFHAAGPFIQTGPPMIQACLDSGVHYVDITGEIPALQYTLAHNKAACSRGILLLSGAGFDVIPTDCLVSYVSSQVPRANVLEVALATTGRASPGTVKSALGMISFGGRIRRDGKLVSFPLGKGGKEIVFSDRKRFALPIPWGDLETAYKTTGIPNITTYLALPPALVTQINWLRPVLQGSLSISPFRRAFQHLAARMAQGPSQKDRNSGRSFIWARAASPYGQQTQAWLETMEAYRFTAVAGIRSVEKILETEPIGALTPSQAFGPDFVLEIETTNRLDFLSPDRFSGLSTNS